MQKEIRVAGREVLLTRDYLFALATAMTTLDLSRRAVPDWLADTIFGWVEDGGVILDGEGREIVIHADIIDDAHGEDGSFQWVSAQRQRVANPPRRKPRQSMLLRLQLYDAAFRIAGRPVDPADAD